MSKWSNLLARGYVTSRPIRGNNYPHRIQNILIREFCDRYSLQYQLSFTEYSAPSCYMMLEDLFKNLGDSYKGIVSISLFTMPNNKERRLRLYNKVLEQKAVLFFVLEQLTLKDRKDIQIIEQIYSIDRALKQTPLSGRYEKNSANNQVLDLCKTLGLKPNSW